MKRGLLGFPLLVFLIQVVSAQFFGGYGRFSLGEFFNRIDPQTFILSLLFLILFALIFYPLSRFFKGPYGQPNKAIAGIIAFCGSAIIIYGIYQSGFNLEDLFYGLGIGTGVLYLIVSIIFIILAIFLIKKIKFRGFLIVLGLFLILLTAFTDIFYEKGLVTAIGIVLLLFGLLLWRRSRKVMGSIGRGTWKVGRGIGKAAWSPIRKRRKSIQQKQQKTQIREDIRRKTHDTINEIRRIDRELRSIPARIGVANRQGNREQVMILEQERIRLKQQRRDLEKEIRRFRREHSGNI
jgi:hypothetical protein